MLGAEALAQRSARDFHLPMVERAARERYDYGRDRGNKIVQVCAQASSLQSIRASSSNCSNSNLRLRAEARASRTRICHPSTADLMSSAAMRLSSRVVPWIGSGSGSLSSEGMV